MNKFSILTHHYWGLLQNLPNEVKMDLIDKLKDSIEAEPKKDNFQEAFGAWHDDENAEEMIEKIRSSRNFKRDIETL